jgi:HD-GYP domain-containing protein (c-di-GMP phosphodiesterase class II)
LDRERALLAKARSTLPTRTTSRARTPESNDQALYCRIREKASGDILRRLGTWDPLLDDPRVISAIQESTRQLSFMDRATLEHQWRTAETAGGIGTRLGLAENRLRQLVTAASLHDVGKLFIPESLLHRPGPLSADEYHIIRDHSAHGESWLLEYEVPQPIPNIVRWHHERWDGRGYPDRLAGESIPIESRVLALADALDAMVSIRPYHGGRSLKEVRRILISESGHAFDPSVVEAALGYWS